MDKVTTKYGILKGISYLSHYPDGSVKDCILTQENVLKTPFGRLIPQYEDDGIRRKNLKPVSFYENGILKSISLQNPVEFQTSLGSLTAEYITFHEDGSIKAIFPLDGKISGYWTEEDEYELAPEIEFSFPFGQFKKKVISVRFYQSGGVKSITFWPKDRVTVNSPAGTAEVRIGIALHPDGSLKSLEPAKPLPVKTPIGTISAYDNSALGLHGDSNSLSFTQDGKIEQIVTTTHQVKVVDQTGKERIYQPGFKANMFNPDARDIVPLTIQFNGGRFCFDNNPENSCNLLECKFTVQPVLFKSTNSCSSCADCSACG
ncbi:MAG: hypothetical protein M0Z31_13205 [Clostridia bacterium]|nr:hypothetical protein [Clostridia bacterium]